MCVFTLHCVLQSLSCWSATYALIVEPSYPIGFLFILRGPIILYGILEFARVVSIWKFGIWTPACCVGPAWPKAASNSSLGLLFARELANPIGAKLLSRVRCAAACTGTPAQKSWHPAAGSWSETWLDLFCCRPSLEGSREPPSKTAMRPPKLRNRLHEVNLCKYSPATSSTQQPTITSNLKFPVPQHAFEAPLSLNAFSIFCQITVLVHNMVWAAMGARPGSPAHKGELLSFVQVPGRLLEAAPC